MFVFLITACYSANLAASLTIQKLDNQLDSIEKLIHQTDIDYGTFGSVSFRLLKNSDYYLHNQIARNIEARTMFLKVYTFLYGELYN